jgi:hypothetical protein
VSPTTSPPWPLSKNALLAFERSYEQAAKPFEGKFTGDDLALLLKRIGRQAASTPTSAQRTT